MTNNITPPSKFFSKLFKPSGDAESLLIAVELLHKKIFYEEYNLTLFAQKKDNSTRSNRGSLYNEYRDTINRKRSILGVSLINEQGLVGDNSSKELCAEDVMARHNNQYTEVSAKIDIILGDEFTEQEHSSRRSKDRLKLIEGVDPLDCSTWTSAMIANSHKHYVAICEWEMIKPLSFGEFDARLKADQDFAFKNAPRNDMEKEDYNPWRKM